MLVFIVVGRLGKSLIVSKVVPFLATGRVDKVYIFSQEIGYTIKKAKYITLPNWLLTGKPVALFKIIRIFYEPLQLLSYSIKYKPHLINGIFTLPKGLNSTIVGKITNTKSLVSVIGGEVEITTRLPFNQFWKSLNLSMLRTCDAITTKGARVSDYLVYEGIPKEKIFIYNGSIDTDKYFFDPGIEKDIDIIFVGTFRKLKGPDRVLKVVTELINQGLDIKAVFLGDGALFGDIVKKIEASNLKENVSLKGYINEPAQYFQRAKILLMPSISEGLPTAMLESMACGCVPVVSDVGNISDVAHHEVNSLLIKHWDDIQSFTHSAKKLLSDNIFWERLSKNARNIVVERYTPEKQAKVVNQIFEYLSLQ